MKSSAKRATSTDVAKKAGVSRATVSMVLNGRTEGTVAEETRKRVLDAAAALNYTRSQAAVSLREQRSRSIGIVSDEILTSPWAGRMLRAADACAHERGYVTLSMDLSIPGISQEGAVRTLEERGVDGIIFATMGALKLEITREMSRVPVALLNCFNAVPAPGCRPLEDFTSGLTFSRDGGPTVAKSGPTLFPEFVPGDYQGGYRAAERLIEVGHSRIAMLSGDDSSIAKRARDAGFRAKCSEAGVDARVIDAGWNFDDGFKAALRLFTDAVSQRPSGLFCIRDRVAAGVLHAAATLGLDVPRDLSVIGFDDEDFFAERLVPPLTTMTLPHLDMGRAAMSLLIDEIESGSEAGPERLTFECPLAERNTVARPSL